MKVSITCIGHNELHHLKDLLPLIQWAYEIVYVDCESTDGSYEWAKAQGCRTFRRANNFNPNINKSYAMEQARGDWIFYLDPDERPTPALSQEVQKKILGTNHCGYKMSRKNYFFGFWLRWGGQYPDTQLRLFRRNQGFFPNKHIHEKLQVQGTIGQLQNPLIHNSYLSIRQFLKKIDFSTQFEAHYLYEKGVRPSLKNHFYFLIYRPFFRFLKRYFLKGGFMDGIPGLIASFFDGVTQRLSYFKLWEISQKEKSSESSQFKLNNREDGS